MTDNDNAKSPNIAGARAIKPGRLKTFAEMTLHTREAQRLVKGRKGSADKPPIVGLFLFASYVRLLWTAAAHDDPFADWYLLEIEQELTQAHDDLTHLQQSVDRLLTGRPTPHIDRSESLDPVRFDLNLSTPYAHMGAWLLGHLDELVLAIMTARHVGVIGRDQTGKMLADAGRPVRRCYGAGHGFRTLTITRADVRQYRAGTHNRKAERASQLMGDLPQPILDGELRGEHAPAIRASAGGSPPEDGNEAPSTATADDSADTV